MPDDFFAQSGVKNIIASLMGSFSHGVLRRHVNPRYALASISSSALMAFYIAPALELIPPHFPAEAISFGIGAAGFYKVCRWIEGLLPKGDGKHE